MAEIGASSPLPPIPAKVALPKRQPPFRLGGRSLSSCPKGIIERASAGAQAAIWSSTRCPSFDNAESRLTTYERHVVGHYRLGEAFQGELADFFEWCSLFDRDGDSLCNKDLAVLGLGA